MHNIVYASGLTGFIGKNLLNFLLKSNDYVINFGRNNKAYIFNNNSQKSITVSKDIFSEFPSDTFINLATLYNPSPLGLEDFNELVEANITFPLNIIDSLMKLHKEINIVNTSSYMQLLPIEFQNQYSLSKEIFLNRIKTNIKNVKNIYLFDKIEKLLL